ncbi:serine/threonine protein kinase [Myxococcus sp. AM011]|uniref:serine/threonine-protein kinase n=1 Tax=Myxococcus sp. AM011 TaxID=2745200 RepID=UPI0015955E92|nr:serine/threonine-protein kinase [Myxococcus sp. AM011]NVJ24438.1 serine/threonine protein kinase [Myxococcus sp. AM011]
MTTTQECPNCGIQHDTRVYVTGQKVTCRCGIRFEVRRQDANGARAASHITFAPHRAQGAPENTRDTVVPGLGADERAPKSTTSYANGGALRDASLLEEREPPRDEPGSVHGRVTMVGGAAEPRGPRSSGIEVLGVNFGAAQPSSTGASPSDMALPGVPLPSVDVAPSFNNANLNNANIGPSGVALPSSTPDLEVPVGATVVRSSTPTGRGNPDSDLNVHEVDTFVAAARVSLPGFELLELLGRGGMGEVWLARQTSLGRTVAVKLLPPKLAKDPEFVARFEKEATALAALNHPNIVQIIDRGVAGEHYYFVMEFVEGRSLREAISTGTLSPQQSLKLMLQVARAVECAHDKDIIHRDLKPENILLDGRGNVKVADFGLAGFRQSESRLQLTATAVAMGTLNYMAPEQRRDAKNVDGRADLFSLGVVLYELLTGEVPLGRFKLPSQRVSGLDPRVDLVVERLLETDPESRYEKAGELCAALDTMISSSSAPGLMTGLQPARQLVTARAPTTSQITRRLRLGWRRVRSGLSIVGGLAVLGFAARWAVDPVLHRGDERDRPGQGTKARTPTRPFPPNTYGETFTTANVVVPPKPGGEARFGVSFEGEGTEELNLHSGRWVIEHGELRAWQGGQDASGRRLVPRAYVAHRYFAADDFDAQVMMDVRPLGDEYPEELDAQHYGELSFRIKDLQVSAFAIPGVGMRLAWRYFTEDGHEVVGNSAQDTDGLVEDEMPLPATGPYLVRLKLSPKAEGVVLAEGFLGKQRFARKLLPGLKNRVGKVAVGCRNLACTFDDLAVRGQLKERPPRQASVGQEQ